VRQVTWQGKPHRVKCPTHCSHPTRIPTYCHLQPYHKQIYPWIPKRATPWPRCRISDGATAVEPMRFAILPLPGSSLLQHFPNKAPNLHYCLHGPGHTKSGQAHDDNIHATSVSPPCSSPEELTCSRASLSTTHPAPKRLRAYCDICVYRCACLNVRQCYQIKHLCNS
jgi:hypothetical protein